MMTNTEIRERLRQGVPTIGTWLQIPSPDVAEIIGCLGYDFAVVDVEHGSFTRADLPNMFRALALHGTTPFARVAEATMTGIKAALDSGAKGIVFPMIETREQLDKAIHWSLYPGSAEYPHGKRGVGFARSNLWGLDFTAQTAPTGNGYDTVIVAQIEHVNALNNLDAIFSHPRLDAYMIGPYDLSASMGLTGQFTHPDFLAALQSIEDAATKNKCPKGYHIVQPDEALLKQKTSQGYSFIAYGIDSLFLQLGKCPR